MPDTPSPGQLAYEAYWRAFAPQFGPLYLHPWTQAHPQNQAAWEAAVQAVLDAVHAECPCFLYAIGAWLRLTDQTRGFPVRARRWVEREILGSYAEYGLETAAEAHLSWVVEADLVPWEDSPHA